MIKPRSPAVRRYVVRLLAMMSLYIGFLTIALRMVGRGSVTGVPAYLLAVLPALAITGVFWAIGRLLVEETDEYQRLLFVRQILIAIAFALSVATVYGFLENFGLAPHVDAFYVAVLWFGGLGIGGFVNKLTLGRGEVS